MSHLSSCCCAKNGMHSYFYPSPCELELVPCKKQCHALIGCQVLKRIPLFLPPGDQHWFYLAKWLSGLNGQLGVLFSFREHNKRRSFRGFFYCHTCKLFSSNRYCSYQHVHSQLCRSKEVLQRVGGMTELSL